MKYGNLAEMENMLTEEQNDVEKEAENVQYDINVQGAQDLDEEKTDKLLRLPLSRVRHIMKMDAEFNLASQEAAFLITKSTELFIESLAREAYKYTALGKRKTLQKKDIDTAVDSVDSLSFLEGIFESL